MGAVAGLLAAHAQGEHAVVEGVEHILQMAHTAVEKFGETRVGHGVKVLIGGTVAHIFARDLFAALPFLVANVERGHLVVGISARLEDRVAQFEKRSVFVDEDVAAEVGAFVADHANEILHCVGEKELGRKKARQRPMKPRLELVRNSSR